MFDPNTLQYYVYTILGPVKSGVTKDLRSFFKEENDQNVSRDCTLNGNKIQNCCFWKVLLTYKDFI